MSNDCMNPFQQRPMKEFETHGSMILQPLETKYEPPSLDEIFREAAREGSLYE